MKILHPSRQAILVCSLIPLCLLILGACECYTGFKPAHKGVRLEFRLDDTEHTYTANDAEKIKAGFEKFGIVARVKFNGVEVSSSPTPSPHGGPQPSSGWKTQIQALLEAPNQQVLETAIIAVTQSIEASGNPR